MQAATGNRVEYTYQELQTARLKGEREQELTPKEVRILGQRVMDGHNRWVREMIWGY